MTDVVRVPLLEAITVIDKALTELGTRTLVSGNELADILVDVRQLILEAQK